MKTWSVRELTAVLMVVVLATGLRAADLGFPENCVELANVTPRGLGASSGVLHVLSVSGMHVAIIFKMLEWLLGILLKIKRGKHLYYVLIIMVLWFYAFLTGLCPSVLRATMMLTFVVIGKWSGRNTGILNTLMVSCFFLLIYNPFLLVDAGFQLSFLAVIGIVILHPMLFRHFQPRNKVLLAIWSVVSISLCAQLITFPISLFYRSNLRCRT